MNWRPVSKPPPERKPILIRFFIREWTQNVEYVLKGERRDGMWIVKAPWDARGLNVERAVLAEGWFPIPQERSSGRRRW